MVRYALWAGDDASSNPAYLIIVGGDNGVVIIINYTLNRGRDQKSSNPPQGSRSTLEG